MVDCVDSGYEIIENYVEFLNSDEGEKLANAYVEFGEYIDG